MYVGIHAAGKRRPVDVGNESEAPIQVAGNGASATRPVPVPALPMDAVGLKAAGAGDPTGADAARQLRRYLRKTLSGSASSKATADDKTAPN
jgi:hypothetical protein